MPQYVKEWMTKNILAIESDYSLSTAISLLCQNNEQFLVYRDKNNNFFILNTIEINKFIPFQSTMKVMDLMSPVTSFGLPDWTLEQALEKMQEEAMNYLPIKDHNQALVGVLSIEAFFVAVQEIKWKKDMSKDQ